MTGWTLTPKAAADIDSIWDFSAERWGIGQADMGCEGRRKGNCKRT